MRINSLLYSLKSLTILALVTCTFSIYGQTSLGSLFEHHIDPYNPFLQHQRDKTVFEFRVSLDKTHPFNYGEIPFEIEVQFQIYYRDFSNQIAMSAPVSLMILNNANPEGVYYEELPSYIFSAEVDNIQYTINTGVTTSNYLINTAIPNDIYPQASLDVTYKVGTNGPSQINLHSPTLIHTSLYEFTWHTPPEEEYVNYEFQLLKLYNTDPQYASNIATIKIDKLDWNQALSIETESSSTQLKVLLAEGDGFYLWRVRPIGNIHDGGIANPKNWGPWAWYYTVTDGSTITTSMAATDVNILYITDPESHMNKIYSRSFSEGAKIKETIKYANYLGMLRQQQIFIPSANSTVTVQSYDDYSGRPAMSTIPIPEENNRLGGYKDKLVTDKTSGNLYNQGDFDENDGVPSSNIDDGSGSNLEYYGGSYTDDHGNVPDAEGNIFRRTLYMNDGTDRILEQSLPGGQHNIGQHTKKIFYTSPSESELIAMFGDEAPNSEQISKIITYDENNTASVTYKNTDGEIIASAISETEPGIENGALYKINDPNTSLVLTEANNKSNLSTNIRTERGFESVKRLSVTQNTDLSLDYIFDCGTMVPCPAGGVCDYDVKIVVRNLDISNPADPDYLYEFWTTSVSSSNCSSTPISSFYHNGDVLNPVSNMTTSSQLKPQYHYLIQKILTPTTTVGNFSSGAYNQGKEKTDPFVKLVKYWLDDDTKSVADFAADVNNYPTSVDDPTELGFFGGVAPNPTSGDFKNYFFTVDNASNPTKIILTTPCCGALEVPLKDAFDFTCHDLSTYPNPTSLFQYVDFAIRNAATPRTPINDMDFSGYMEEAFYESGISGFSGFLGGYSAQELNDMIYHMLTDQYSCQSINAAGPDEVQYECEDLWNCWISAVSTAVNIGTSLDKNHKVDDNPNVDWDFFDPFNKIPLKWLFGDLGDGMQGEDKGKNFTLNVVEQFLECTGYNFASVLSSVAGFTNNVMPGDNVNDKRLAFKYFKYDDGNFGGAGFGKAAQLENEFCYVTFPGPTDLCNPNICTTNVLDWECSDREEFYKALRDKVTPSQPQNPKPQYCWEQEVIDEMNTMELGLINTCIKRCDERRPEFRVSTIRMFTDNCYEIGSCDGPTWEDIDKIVDEMVIKCKDVCNQIELTCTDIFSCASPGNNLPNIHMLDPCVETNMYRVMTSTLRMDIQSQCPTGPPWSLSGGNNCDMAQDSPVISVQIDTN